MPSLWLAAVKAPRLAVARLGWPRRRAARARERARSVRPSPRRSAARAPCRSSACSRLPGVGVEPDRSARGRTSLARSLRLGASGSIGPRRQSPIDDEGRSVPALRRLRALELTRSPEPSSKVFGGSSGARWRRSSPPHLRTPPGLNHSRGILPISGACIAGERSGGAVQHSAFGWMPDATCAPRPACLRTECRKVCVESQPAPPGRVARTDS